MRGDQANRLGTGGLIDRSAPLNFRFDGKTFSGFKGDTLASALVANGGRVLNVTATGATVGAAQERAYRAVDSIDWPQGFCRRDIGWRAIEREQAGT